MHDVKSFELEKRVQRLEMESLGAWFVSIVSFGLSIGAICLLLSQ